MVAYAERQGKDVATLKEWLKQAWEDLLLSEVSDSSGWDPWLVEVQYTDVEADAARKLLAQIMEQLRKLVSIPVGGWTVDTRTGVVAGERGADGASVGAAAALPVDCAVRAEKFTTSVRLLRDSLYQLDIECVRPADGAVRDLVRDVGGMGYGIRLPVERMPVSLSQRPILMIGVWVGQWLYLFEQWV